MSRRRVGRVERVEIKRVCNGFIVTVDPGLSRHEVIMSGNVLVAENQVSLGALIDQIEWEDLSDE